MPQLVLNDCHAQARISKEERGHLDELHPIIYVISDLHTLIVLALV
jgi:hypothetical protein